MRNLHNRLLIGGAVLSLFAADMAVMGKSCA